MFFVISVIDVETSNTNIDLINHEGTIKCMIIYYFLVVSKDLFQGRTRVTIPLEYVPIIRTPVHRISRIAAISLTMDAGFGQITAAVASKLMIRNITF